MVDAMKVDGNDVLLTMATMCMEKYRGRRLALTRLSAIVECCSEATQGWRETETIAEGRRWDAVEGVTGQLESRSRIRGKEVTVR